MINKEDAAGKIVRVKNRTEDQLGLFACSSIAVGAGMAGTFLDNGEGNVIPLVNMIEIVDPDEADKEHLRWDANKRRERIEAVVRNVDDSQKEFEGTIVLHIAFQGSLPKTKAFTRAERGAVLSGTSAEVDQSKIKGAKTLFESEEYDAIEHFKSSRRAEFANLGIPFPLGDSMYLIRIVNIPKAEDLAAKTQKEMATLVSKLQEVYASQITPEATGLGPLYNAGDYKSPEALESLFRFRSKWMHFGVPEILREIDEELWNKERERTAAVWQEAKEQGLILLRQTTADMVKRLVEAVTPDAEGKKKRFYATAVTNLTDFFEVFEDRNLAGDKELTETVNQLRELIAGRTVEEFKTDDNLRSFVQKKGVEIQGALETMLISSRARQIVFED